MRTLTIMAAAVVCFSIGGSSRAQLSPGDLHQSHAFLEGVENCTKCHGSDRQLVSGKCLECHNAIRERLDTGTGLHGRQQYRECQLCHIEHQGREFDLVHWKEGMNRFDHNLTGFTLIGKHTTAECRACHKQELLVNKAALIEDKVTLSRTFLGLDSLCSSCHFDEHRKQLGNNCSNCHTPDQWRPSVGFDHATAGFPLTGRHLTLDCNKCHPSLTDVANRVDTVYAKYRGIRYGLCTDCHTDVHRGKLGSNCSSCHSTADWLVTDKASFDHNRTRYPLTGKHAEVACAGCHKQGSRQTGLAFAACRDCHSDFHQGQFAAREQRGACEECHTVNGYSPSRFTIAAHEKTKYPLTGAHLAVPCLACHIADQNATRTEKYRFRFSSVKCQACHSDPHKKSATRFVDEAGCESCHRESAWSSLSFDHARTKFALEGKHVTVPCIKCHPASSGAKTAVFANTTSRCVDCHRDIHQGQFLAADQTNDCSRCHTAQEWRPSRFDHNTSRFKLEGAHKKVACRKCHFARPSETDSVVVFRPLKTACADCHSGTPGQLLEDKS